MKMTLVLLMSISAVLGSAYADDVAVTQLSNLNSQLMTVVQLNTVAVAANPSSPNLKETDVYATVTYQVRCTNKAVGYTQIQNPNSTSPNNYLLYVETFPVMTGGAVICHSIILHTEKVLIGKFPGVVPADLEVNGVEMSKS